MEVLTYDQIAFILLEMSALFLTGGLLWFTTPFRKRNNPGDKLFFILEICCIADIIADTALFIAILQFENEELPIPFSTDFYGIVGSFFEIGSYFFDAFLLLYVLSLLKNGSQLLRLVKIPVLAVAAVKSILLNLPLILPEKYYDIMEPFFMSSIHIKIYHIYLILTLAVLLFVDIKLVLYYIFVYAVWNILSKITPVTGYVALLHVMELVFTYIIIISRELGAKSTNAITIKDLCS